MLPFFAFLNDLNFPRTHVEFRKYYRIECFVYRRKAFWFLLKMFCARIARYTCPFLDSGSEYLLSNIFMKLFGLLDLVLCYRSNVFLNFAF